MKKLIVLILFPFLLIPFETKSNENFSVEIEALTLVMEKYQKDSKSNIESNSKNKHAPPLAITADISTPTHMSKSLINHLINRGTWGWDGNVDPWRPCDCLEAPHV